MLRRALNTKLLNRTMHQLSTKPSTPLFSFGVVSDIQYANKPVQHGRSRFELDALYKLNKCISHWKEYQHPLKCIVNLGDIIDGHEDRCPTKDSEDLRDVLEALRQLHIPTYHVLGNHCVWNLGCNYLVKELGMKHRFYDVELHSGWRFVFLDGTDLSLMKDSHSLQEAQEYMKTNAHRLLEDWNGGVSKRQRDWLTGVISAAKTNNEKVIVFCHWPLLNPWGPEMEPSMMWNADEILPLLDPEVVFMFMSGHIHENGYVKHNGVHHITLSAVVSAPFGENAHAVVHIHDDEVVIEGFGTVSPLSGVLKLDDDGGADDSNILHTISSRNIVIGVDSNI